MSVKSKRKPWKIERVMKSVGEVWGHRETDSRDAVAALDWSG